tara:strand:- start:2708 stop:2980 length:273 start_codon:yes stop_codon:yes gene_type:complete
MKKIFLILITSVFFAEISYAKNDCKKLNTVLQQKEYKECLGQNPNNVSKKNGKLIKKIIPGSVKDASKKVLSKMNTDSKLTDYIKKKMGK